VEHQEKHDRDKRANQQDVVGDAAKFKVFRKVSIGVLVAKRRSVSSRKPLALLDR